MTRQSLTTPLDVARLRAAQRATEPLPYERLASADRWTEETCATADATIEEGWKDRSFPRVSLATPIAWDELCAEHRTWYFHLHCWDALSPVLAAYDRTGEPSYLRFAIDVALDWARQYPSLDSDSPFAWYDMAIGLRAYRLAYVADAAARADSCEDDAVAELFECALLHAAALADDDRFAPHSNHGFYFAAGQLALGRRLRTLPGMRDASRQGQERIGTLIRAQFTEEGVHREHSPDYHRMVMETFEGLLEARLVESPEFRRMLEPIEEALAWFVLPNGRLALFGDTPHRLMVRKRFEHVGSDALRFVVSGGKSGTPPAEAMRAFPASGYVVFRDGWPSGPGEYANWSYLAQMCAFHSRVHKHADDLSFVWYDRGSELLADSGRFGYLDPATPDFELWDEGFWYANPNRVYVESTRAHNTVEVDGRSFPRLKVKPYGSALQRYGERGGVYYSEAQALHWRAVEHARVLLFRPSEWLIVFDRVRDKRHAPHRFVQRFHFAPELEVRTVGAGVEAVLPDRDERLFMVSFLGAEPVEPVKGRTEPELLGWISRAEGEMAPTSTAGYAGEGESCVFATLFAFGEQLPEIDRETAVRPHGRAATLRWRHDGLHHTVSFARPSEKPFAVDYAVALGEER